MKYTQHSFTVPTGHRDPSQCTHGWTDRRGHCVFCGEDRTVRIVKLGGVDIVAHPRTSGPFYRAMDAAFATAREPPSEPLGLIDCLTFRTGTFDLRDRDGGITWDDDV